MYPASSQILEYCTKNIIPPRCQPLVQLPAPWSALYLDYRQDIQTLELTDRPTKEPTDRPTEEPAEEPTEEPTR